MIVELGHFALCLALVAAIAQSIGPIWGLRTDSASALRLGDSAAQAQFAAAALAFGALTYAFVVSDFSVALVAYNSHSAKPMLYKVTGVWANHEGSMLLWVLMLSLFGALISIFGRMMPLNFRATVLAVQGMVGVGFFAFILLTSNPFDRLITAPFDGAGMNPLLQDPGVAFHPPLLYVGYVGFSTAFSFAVAALILGRAGPTWARWMRPWVLFAWAGLTAGIALGSWWAYYELGWGGFWFWDPVENASFMPWLLGTALLHSAIVVEKRAALLKWTILLAILTFGLSLIGTFLVRSGILSSVHAFATDPARGLFILILLLIALVGAFSLYAWRAPKLEEGGDFAVTSRESGLLANNMILTACCGIVFVGTLYPLFVDLMGGSKLTVGAPYFNKTFVPVFCVLMLIAGLGPLMAWKRAKLAALLRDAGLCVGLTIAAVALLAVFGARDAIGLAGAAVAIFLLVATGLDLSRRAGLPKVSAAVALRRLAGLPRSAWGMYVGHAGVAIAAAGVVAISVWRVEAIQTQKVGESVTVGAYEFTLTEVAQQRGPNYQATVAQVVVTRDGDARASLQPERRWYPVEAQATAEAGIRSGWHGDYYAVIGEPSGDGYVTRHYYNPGVPWMWLGAALITLSGLVSLADRRLRVGAPSGLRLPGAATPQPAE